MALLQGVDMAMCTTKIIVQSTVLLPVDNKDDCMIDYTNCDHRKESGGYPMLLLALIYFSTTEWFFLMKTTLL